MIYKCFFQHLHGFTSFLLFRNKSRFTLVDGEVKSEIFLNKQVNESQIAGIVKDNKAGV